MIGSQGREMKSTVMTSRLGTETAWHRSGLSHMWNCSCLWHLRLLDTGYSVITLCMILNSSLLCFLSKHIAFRWNISVFTAFTQAFWDKEDGCLRRIITIILQGHFRNAFVSICVICFMFHAMNTHFPCKLLCKLCCVRFQVDIGGIIGTVHRIVVLVW